MRHPVVSAKLRAAWHELCCRECRVTWRSWWQRLHDDQRGFGPLEVREREVRSKLERELMQDLIKARMRVADLERAICSYREVVRKWDHTEGDAEDLFAVLDRGENAPFGDASHGGTM